MELNVNVSCSEAMGFFRIEEHRGRELQAISVGILESNSATAGERIANALALCETENERMFLCNCIGVTVTARVAAISNDSPSKFDRRVAVHMAYTADAIMLLARLADVGGGDPIVIKGLTKMRAVLDEIIGTNLDPNPRLIKDILESAISDYSL
jgi:hypothetical protein